MKCYAQYSGNPITSSLQELIDLPDSTAAKKRYYEEDSQQLLKNASLTENAIVDTIKVFDRTEGGLDYKELLPDIVSTIALYGASVEEFFQFRFREKNHVGRMSYTCDKERFSLFRSFYDFDRYEQVRNKWNQYKALKEYFGRDCIYLDQSEDCTPFSMFREFAMHHPRMIQKPVRAYGGHGVRVIEAPGDEFAQRELYRALLKDAPEGCVLDEPIIQGEETAKFHPTSVNTVRLIAARDLSDRNHFFQALFRMGRGKGIVDNSNEAIRAMLDTESGYVYTGGADSYGNHYIVHPDTGIVIPGFHLPEWEEALAIADNVMQKLSSYARFIGFDFAYSTTGWKIIEINSFPQLVTQQIIMNKGSKQIILGILKDCGCFVD